MNRNFLFECYETAKGQLLLQSEAEFLRRSITVSCKQSILQIGELGWENKFIDSSFYQSFVVLDIRNSGPNETRKILAHPSSLPVQEDSVDMIILPHLLEFEQNQHQTLREIERVLKPEGKLIILNFNPWNWWVRYKYISTQVKDDPLMRSFISRYKIMDWLKLLNFEVDVVAGFNFKSTWRFDHKNKNSLSIVSYAVKAIKRRYNIIPLTGVEVRKPRFAVATAIETPTRLRKHEGYSHHIHRRSLSGKSGTRRMGRSFAIQ